jgi:hypothetical protein
MTIERHCHAGTLQPVRDAAIADKSLLQSLFSFMLKLTGNLDLSTR